MVKKLYRTFVPRLCNFALRRLIFALATAHSRLSIAPLHSLIFDLIMKVQRYEWLFCPKLRRCLWPQRNTILSYLYLHVSYDKNYTCKVWSTLQIHLKIKHRLLKPVKQNKIHSCDMLIYKK